MMGHAELVAKAGSPDSPPPPPPPPGFELSGGWGVGLGLLFNNQPGGPRGKRKSLKETQW